MTDVKMKHPARKGNRAIEVRNDQVEMYKSQGWIEADSPKPAADKPAKK